MSEVKAGLNREKPILYLALLEALFVEVPKWRDAFRNGPLDGVIEAHENLIDAWLDVRDLAHKLSHVEEHSQESTVMLALEQRATQEAMRLTQFGKLSSSAAVGC